MTDKTEAPERHQNKQRNLILNTAVRELDVIINNHDPDIHGTICQEVWDYLDKMSLQVENLARTDACAEVTSDWVLIGKAAHEFGVRYQTNARLLAFIDAVIATRPASEVHQEGYDAGKAAGRAEALEELKAALMGADFGKIDDPELVALAMLKIVEHLINKETGK